MNKIISQIFNFLFMVLAGGTLFYQINIVTSQQGDIHIKSPETYQAFYDELKSQPKVYFIESENDFELGINLLVPLVQGGIGKDDKYLPSILIEPADASTEYVFEDYEGIIFRTFLLDGSSWEWQEFYDPLARDHYFKGPEIARFIPAGKYRIKVFSKNNTVAYPEGSPQSEEERLRENFGKYVLRIGNKKPTGFLSILNACWQIPLLKLSFFKTSVLQFFLTPFAIIGIGIIGAFLFFLALIYYIIGAIKIAITHSQAKTLLLTSGGMEPMKDEITKLLQKPAYDITVAFINTAAKPQEDIDYVNRDIIIMREEMGFNVEEIDIDEKKEREVMKLLKLKDIIFVAGGNTFYLLNAMRKCNFERVIRKLLKEGKVYIGVSAGSMVAGKSIKTGLWKDESKNIAGLKSLNGLGLVPFDIFVHYQPEYAEIIKKKTPWKWQRRKLRILTDEQAILVQGKKDYLIGEGEAVVL